MRIPDAIVALRRAFVAQGIAPATVEIVMPQADAEKLQAAIGGLGAGPANRSLCVAGGFLFVGEPHVSDHSNLMGDLLDVRQD